MVRASSKKSPVLHLGPVQKYPQILPQNPKIWVIMTNHPTLLSNLTQLVKISLCYIITPHSEIMVYNMQRLIMFLKLFMMTIEMCDYVACSPLVAGDN